MSMRFALPVLIGTALATPAFAQTIDYGTGEHRLAASDAEDATVTQSAPAEQIPLPADRVIAQRRNGAVPPVFVSRPVIQGMTTPDVEGRPVAPIATPGATPVYYAYPVQPQTPVPSGTLGYVPPIAPGSVGYPQSYAAAAPLPAGSQIVTFNRDNWLSACRERLAGYGSDAEREAAMGALGGAAAGQIPGQDRCEAYLDSYVNSASAGTLATQPHYGQQYMLVPVTVMVPQMPAPSAR